MELCFLLVFFPVTYSVKHSLTYFFTVSPGLQTFPEYMVVSEFDGVQVGYCDSNNLIAEFRPDWAKKLNDDDPEHMEWHNEGCKNYYYDNKAVLEGIKQHLNQTEGVHILQEFAGCEWDNETEEINGYVKYSYDGEDFITMDMENQRWLFSEQAATYKDKWDPGKARLYGDTGNIKNNVLHWLKKYLVDGKSSLLRKDLPSVSFLQKSPSSPVSCHATGFYPDRATMFWRKDGQELHEDVDHGEILPNHDGTFQMRVDLNISSVKSEDWRRYDCVFQLSGVEKNIITKLDKPVIRTNWEKPSDMFIPMIAAGAVLLLLIVVVLGLVMYKVKKAQSSAQNRNTASSNVSLRDLHTSERSSNNSPAVSVCSDTPLIPE